MVSVFMLSQQWSSALYSSTDTANVTPTIRTGSPEKQTGSWTFVTPVQQQKKKEEESVQSCTVWRGTLSAAESECFKLFSLKGSILHAGTMTVWPGSHHNIDVINVGGGMFDAHLWRVILTKAWFNCCFEKQECARYTTGELASWHMSDLNARLN